MPYNFLFFIFFRCLLGKGGSTVRYGIFPPARTVRNYGTILLFKYGMVQNYVIFSVPFPYLFIPM